MKRVLNSSNVSNKANLKFSKGRKEEILEDLDLNEILNIEFEEERELIKLIIRKINKITHIRDIKDYFRTFGNVISCELNSGDAKNYCENYAVIILEDKDELLNKLLKCTHILNGSHISVHAEKLKKKEQFSTTNSSKNKHKLPCDDEKELLFSFKSNKINNESIKPSDSLTLENSFSKFDALNFTFRKEYYGSENSNKNIKRNSSNKDKENKSFTLLNNKRTSNFSLGLSLDKTRTDFDYYSNAECPSTPTFKNTAYSNESLFKKNSSNYGRSTQAKCLLDDFTEKINNFFNWN